MNGRNTFLATTCLLGLGSVVSAAEVPDGMVKKSESRTEDSYTVVYVLENNPQSPVVEIRASGSDDQVTLTTIVDGEPYTLQTISISGDSTVGKVITEISVTEFVIVEDDGVRKGAIHIRTRCQETIATFEMETKFKIDKSTIDSVTADLEGDC